MSNSNVSRAILISIDNLRADCVSFNPDKSALAQYSLDHWPATPTLDRLAAQGAAFTRCFAAASYTTASHASILTGMFPAHHGIHEYYRQALSKDVKTILEIFKAAGYTTLLATDFPFLIGPNLGFTRSVDHYIAENDAQVLQLLNTHRADKIFAFVHWGSVHNPFGLTSMLVDGDRFAQQVERLGEKMGVPEQFELEQEWVERPRATRERLLRQRYFKCTDLLYQQGRYDELMQLYIEGIEYFDAYRFRNFIEQIETAGLLDDAVLAIVSDHGEEYSGRAFAHYNGLWEGIVNVPLILLGPGVPKGQLRQSVCRTVDVAPTLLDLSINEPGLSSQNFDGISLLPHIPDEPAELTARGETWFGYTDRILDFMALCQSSGRLLKTKSMANTRIEYLRTSRWKLILRTDLEQGQEQVALFDIEKDRLEKNDLSAQEPSLVKKMKSQIIAERGQIEGQELYIEEHQLKELALNFKDLGYLKGKVP